MIRTRFPPEPNGYLHLGHAKALRYDAEYALENNGSFYLRLDNTNPDTEKQEYEDLIIEDVEWLGYKPDKITHTSDYFSELFGFAEKMILDGNAYIDTLGSDEIQRLRAKGVLSPYRTRDRQESLNLFHEMRDGKHPNGKMVLRMLVEEDNKNPTMMDPVMYVIKHREHYRTGTQWCIYPSYDFSHPIVDSIEGITHSFCSIEFRIRRDLYYWVLDKLGLRKPVVVEFNRLDVGFGTLSKRRIRDIITDKKLSGWDDPLLLTLSGLKKRGYPPDAILNFCKELHYTPTNAKIEEALFKRCITTTLNEKARRCFGVIEPLELVILDPPGFSEVDRPVNPINPDEGTTRIPFADRLFIEKTDFELEPPKKYFRLAPTIPVRLKYALIVEYDHHDMDESGNVERVYVRQHKDQSIKVRGNIHWVVPGNPTRINFFDYNQYIKRSFDGYVDVVDDEYLQFERIGYFKRVAPNEYNSLVDLKKGF